MKITAAQLTRIARDSSCHGYNRLLVEDFVAEGDGWSLHPVMVHEHIAGEPAEPHMRCFLRKTGDILGLLDVSFWMLNVIRRECVELGLVQPEEVGLSSHASSKATAKRKRRPQPKPRSGARKANMPVTIGGVS